MPCNLELWAVANPNIEKDASLLEAKMEAGATTVLTQPPFNLTAFERWKADADRRGIILDNSREGGEGKVRLIVGMPFISSPSNLSFWLSLAGCSSNQACKALLSDFQAASTSASLHNYSLKYSESVLQSLFPAEAESQGLNGRISGLHLMPITKVI